eukprot:2063642-Amphidinium_carterae.1
MSGKVPSKTSVRRVFACQAATPSSEVVAWERRKDEETSCTSKGLPEKVYGVACSNYRTMSQSFTHDRSGAL